MRWQRISVCLAMVVAACGQSGESPPSDSALRPSDVQGAGGTSPYVGQHRTVTGVVSGDFQPGPGDDGELGGFFMQSLQPDSDTQTSDGLFVFDAGTDGMDVAVGDIVAVTGEVIEFHGETQLVAESIERTGHGEPMAVTLPWPAAGTTTNADGELLADLEAFEGMLVTLPAPFYIQDLYSLERFGEMLLSSVPREYQFTEVERPDPAAFAAYQAQFAARTLLLDDGERSQNLRPPRYLAVPGIDARPPRLGDAVTAVTGVLRYSRGSGEHGAEAWRLVPTSPPEFAARNPRPAPLQASGPGSVVVAGFNLLNYFATADAGVPACGPTGSDGCRGADSAAELERQRARTATAIRATGADIVGVMELENDPRAAIDDLVAALNGNGGAWRHVDTGVIGDDAIRVALLYRADRVTAVGDYAILDASVDARFDDDRNRPALAQTFAAGGSRFTIAVNHLKSKGSPCDAGGDPDRGDGQGNCSRTRTRAAAALADWLASDPTASGSPDRLIIGDLNAYSEEDPVVTLEDAGFVNLLDARASEPAYSFVFRGQSGALDHALASPSLAARVTAAAEWHANADEAPLIDYNLEHGRDPALFDGAAPWRSSDHDPLLVVIGPPAE